MDMVKYPQHTKDIFDIMASYTTFVNITLIVFSVDKLSPDRQKELRLEMINVLEEIKSEFIKMKNPT